MLDSYSQQILDKVACRQLIEAYWYLENTRDAKAIAKLFTDDGRWGSAVGHDELVAQAERFFEGMKSLAANPTGFGTVNVDVDGDRATGYVVGIAHVIARQESGPDKIVVVGPVYDAEFRRVDGEWRISSLTGVDDPSRAHDVSFNFEAIATEYRGGRASSSEAAG